MGVETDRSGCHRSLCCACHTHAETSFHVQWCKCARAIIKINMNSQTRPTKPATAAPNIPNASISRTASLVVTAGITKLHIVATGRRTKRNKASLNVAFANHDASTVTTTWRTDRKQCNAAKRDDPTRVIVELDSIRSATSTSVFVVVFINDRSPYALTTDRDNFA